MKKPELLCPVGGADTLQAALLGGADAVYFGGKEFNARMNAKNFDRDAIRRAVLQCHEKGVRVYITLNTLLTDRQLPQAVEFAQFLYEAGADALIVADLGLASLCRKAVPELELHASTQASGHNAEAAKRLADLGFSRMVCARELDRDNLRLLCRTSPIEIELFVHGAICASHSGQCLMSSMIGDRSGNRGECAQPCRLPYNNGYPLSFKDLSLAHRIPEILELGVSSLKIEGRMKSPEYVYNVTRVWRRLLDEERSATQKEMDFLSGVFSRSGFTDGYFTRTLSRDMLGIRTAEDKKKTGDTRSVFRDSGRRAPALIASPRPLEPFAVTLPPKEKTAFRRTARFYRAESVRGTDFFHQIYLPPDQFDPALANGVFLPAAIFDGERSRIRSLLEAAAHRGARHLLVGNLGHLSLAEGLPFTLHGDFRLNVTNSFALTQTEEWEDVIVSPELNLAQLRDLRGKKSVIVYGRIPLMLLERPVGTKVLRDRRGVSFPVIGEGERDVVLNSVPIWMADRAKDLKEKGLVSQHFLFTVESGAQVEEILSAYRSGDAPKGSVRRIK